jgi:hypothetical protein
MPHDSKGREIHSGDLVKVKAWHKGGKHDIQRVVGISEGQTSCNIHCAPSEPQVPASSQNASEVEIVLKADGSEPAPVDAPEKA